jgi:hypothetical protein
LEGKKPLHTGQATSIQAKVVLLVSFLAGLAGSENKKSGLEIFRPWGRGLGRLSPEGAMEPPHNENLLPVYT